MNIILVHLNPAKFFSMNDMYTVYMFTCDVIHSGKHSCDSKRTRMFAMYYSNNIHNNNYYSHFGTDRARCRENVFAYDEYPFTTR